VSLAPAHLTRKLSGRARILFAEWTAAVLRDHAGEVGMDEATQDQYRRRLDALTPRDRRRLKEATRRWETEFPRVATIDENDHTGTPSQNHLATYAAAHAAELEEPISECSLIEDGVYLGAIRDDLREKAVRDFRNGLIRLFLTGAMQRAGGGQQDPLDLVVKNAGALHAGGEYERALAAAYRLAHARDRWPSQTLRWLFSLADRASLRACGDPLSAAGPFEVFRGGGAGAALSWTRDPLVAAWFALQSPARAIRRATLDASDVSAYFHEAVIGAPPRDRHAAATEARALERGGLVEIVETLL
jgi:hypothetical protein